MNDKHAEELIKALDEIDSTLMRIANSLLHWLVCRRDSMGVDMKPSYFW